MHEGRLCKTVKCGLHIDSWSFNKNWKMEREINVVLVVFFCGMLIFHDLGLCLAAWSIVSFWAGSDTRVTRILVQLTAFLKGYSNNRAIYDGDIWKNCGLNASFFCYVGCCNYSWGDSAIYHSREFFSPSLKLHFKQWKAGTLQNMQLAIITMARGTSSRIRESTRSHGLESFSVSQFCAHNQLEYPCIEHSRTYIQIYYIRMYLKTRSRQINYKIDLYLFHVPVKVVSIVHIFLYNHWDI